MEKEFDAIIVGSGTCGAIIARELSKQKKTVLILEQGTNAPLKDNFLGVASIANEVTVADNMKAMRAITTGGSTALYFAVAMLPPLEAFQSLKIDLTSALDEVKKEVPLAELSDNLLGAQTLRLRESAMSLGYGWNKNLMMIDQSKCNSKYSFEAKWKAKDYIQDAVNDGAVLINQAKVFRVIIDQGKAIGVEYKFKNGLMGHTLCKAYGTKIILAAGSLSTPLILRESGIKDVVNHGYFCDPAFAVFGSVPGLKGDDVFLGSMSTDYIDDISYGDGNMTRALFQMLMLSNFNFRLLFSFANTIGVGVKLKDSLGGELKEDGRYNKRLTEQEIKKLKKGEESAVKILKNAGAKYIYKGKLIAANPGGVVRFNEHIDNNLETKYKNLYVCDASVLSENMRVTPTLTLICLSKYLAKNLLLSI